MTINTPVRASCPPRIRIICFFSASYILTLAAEAENGSTRPNLVEVAEARFEDVTVLDEVLFSLLSVEGAPAAADMTAAARFSALTDIWSTVRCVFRVFYAKEEIVYRTNCILIEVNRDWKHNNTQLMTKSLGGYPKLSP